ncbi:hypothetical protein BJX63DRAFT_392246 [Aspergillus granulosus]|uniref:Uncharacterized protein n=1 Tax=Aspergillus granulosus TaxID=176169 RepID=A0ABR4HGY5_9EURO
MDISRLLISTYVEPTTSSNHCRPESHTANSHDNTNQQHLATDSLSHTPQSVPFCPLVPKPPGPLGAGAHTRISPASSEPAELRGHSVRYSPRNQIAWPLLPGGWPGPCLFHPPYGTSRVKDKAPFSPAEDAAMIYILENLGGSRRDVLRAIFRRSYGNINIRRDELYSYCCIQCHHLVSHQVSSIILWLPAEP